MVVVGITYTNHFIFLLVRTHNSFLARSWDEREIPCPPLWAVVGPYGRPKSYALPHYN